MLTGNDEDVFPTHLIFDGSFLWVFNENDLLRNHSNVMRLFPAHDQIRTTYGIGERPSGILSDATSIWLADHAGATVTKITP